MSNLIDVHFHLDYYKDHRAIYERINKLKQYTLCMTNSPGVYLSCKNLYSETKYLKFALGFHPLESKLTDKDFSNFLLLERNSSYIGEVGLDFSDSISIIREKQLIYFDKIVKLCALNNKLMSVHLRKSEIDAIQIIGKYQPKKCVIHWFTGTTEQLNKLVELGCYFSINTNMIKSVSMRNKLKLIPKSHILIESDGPFTSIKSQKFNPEILYQAYEAISIGIQEPNIIQIAQSNFKHILEIPS